LDRKPSHLFTRATTLHIRPNRSFQRLGEGGWVALYVWREGGGGLDRGQKRIWRKVEGEKGFENLSEKKPLKGGDSLTDVKALGPERGTEKKKVEGEREGRKDARDLDH